MSGVWDCITRLLKVVQTVAGPSECAARSVHDARPVDVDMYRHIGGGAQLSEQRCPIGSRKLFAHPIDTAPSALWASRMRRSVDMMATP